MCLCKELKSFFYSTVRTAYSFQYLLGNINHVWGGFTIHSLINTSALKGIVRNLWNNKLGLAWRSSLYKVAPIWLLLTTVWNIYLKYLNTIKSTRNVRCSLSTQAAPPGDRIVKMRVGKNTHWVYCKLKKSIFPADCPKLTWWAKLFGLCVGRWQ